jgi:dTDP-4-amino-4,6-dideoxygalactose transaminase
MTELEAAIARAQLGKLPGLFAHRHRLATHLSERLRTIPGLTPPSVEPGVASANYLYVMTLSPDVGVSRDAVVAALVAEGIPVCGGYVRPLYLQPLYQRWADPSRCPWSHRGDAPPVNYAPGACPVAERLSEREWIVGSFCHPPQTEADMDDVARAVEKVMGRLDALRRVGHPPSVDPQPVRAAA